MFKKFGQDLPESLIDAVNSVISEAKDDEPAKPDADAIARRKRLQALRDKQEDDAAEKSIKQDTPVRKVAGTQYGGAKQKDDMDEELKGNQHKIDANKNGKIDAHDFKLLKSKKKVDEDVEELDEKAVSTAQQKFMGMVYAAKKGEKAASPAVAKAAAGMSKKDAKDFASTKHKGLPTHKEEYELEEELVLDLTEGSDDYTHQVVHVKTGNVVGKYKSLKQASRAADKKDNAYGGVAHVVKPIGEAKEDDDLPFDPDKKQKKSAVPGKSGYGPSAARHLARLGMKAAQKKKTDETVMGKAGCTSEETELDEATSSEIQADVNSRRRASINAINQNHPKTTGQKILSKLTGGRVDAKTKTDPETGKKYTNVTLVKNKKGSSERPLGKEFGKDHKVGFSVKEENELDEAKNTHSIYNVGVETKDDHGRTVQSHRVTVKRGDDEEDRVKKAVSKHYGDKPHQINYVQKGLFNRKNPSVNKGITEGVDIDESRGHKIIARKLADIDRRSSGVAPDYHVNSQSIRDKLKDKRNTDKVEIVNQKDTSVAKPDYEISPLKQMQHLDKTRHGYGKVVHKEEVEELDEVSAELIGRYSDKANKEYNDPKTPADKKAKRRTGLMLGYNKAKGRANVPASYKEEVELDETAALDQYIKAMGYDPQNIDKNKKVMFSKTNAFKTWMSSRNENKTPGAEDDVHMSPGATARG
jgi:hypothetical protein